MNFSEAMFYENYLTSDFHTNTVNSSPFAYRQNGVENRDKAYLFKFDFAQRKRKFLSVLMVGCFNSALLRCAMFRRPFTTKYKRQYAAI